MHCRQQAAEVLIGGWARSSGTCWRCCPRFCAFRASLVTIAANPKAAVFAFSFFPQFLPRHGPVFGTTLALAAVQLVLDSTYCVLVVLLASRARHWLSRVVVRRRLERILGATLVALGIDLAAASR